MQLVVFSEGIDQLHPELVIQQHHLDSIPHSAGDVQPPTALLGQPQQLLCPLPLELAILEQHLQHPPHALCIAPTVHTSSVQGSNSTTARPLHGSNSVEACPLL